jgi:hypothetical protein
MLLKAFSFSSDGVEFHQVCYSSEGNCCDYYKCALRQPNQNVDSYIDKIAKMLYDIRCDFAHNAKLNHFTYKPEENYESCLIGVYSNKLVEIRLSFDSFEDLARKMIYRYLEDKICKNINWQSP